ncbi:MAG: HpcH/HpaI aldolase/citrate lyase family protein [Actinomycetota bacterium]
MPDRDRLHRSELAVPASNLRMLEKAPATGADVVFLDLEDAVAPGDKEQARTNAIAALGGQDWSGCAVSVRINGLDTHWAYRDVIDIVEAVGNRLDMILVPKVGRPADLEFVALLLSQIEQAHGLEPIALSALIETAPGMANVERIAECCPYRLEALVFGVGDYAASTRARTTGIGGANPDYAILTDADPAGGRELHWGDPWHYGLARVVVAARANGLRPIDGPFGDVEDPDGYRRAALRAATLGCDGKWAIHPTQVPIANEVFSPRPEEVERARRSVEAMAEAAREHRGAVALDGRLIDAASIKMAENVLARAERLR